MEARVDVNKAIFSRRLKQLYDLWQGPTHGGLGPAQALLVATGTTNDEVTKEVTKSVALQRWLFGYELPDTLIAFTDSELRVLSSQRKVDVLQPLVEVANEAGIQLHFHVRPKAKSGAAQVKKLLSAVRSSAAASRVTWGVLPPTEHHRGEFFTAVKAAMTTVPGVALLDVSAGLGQLLSVKDRDEVVCHKKAALLATRAMADHVVVQLEAAIDNDAAITHARLAQQTEQAILNPSSINAKLKPANCDTAYPPLFQSGGAYDLTLSPAGLPATSDDTPLHEGVIVVSLGTRYNLYNAVVGRTFFINPTQKQEGEYGALLAAQRAVIRALRDGARTTAVADAVVKALKDAGQAHLLRHLSPSLGHAMGLELRETNTSLTMAVQTQLGVVRAGQVYNVCLSLTGLTDPDWEGKQAYAMLVADTVLVGERGGDVLTSACPNSWESHSYTLMPLSEPAASQPAQPATSNATGPHDGTHFDDDQQVESDSPVEVTRGDSAPPQRQAPVAEAEAAPSQQRSPMMAVEEAAQARAQAPASPTRAAQGQSPRTAVEEPPAPAPLAQEQAPLQPAQADQEQAPAVLIGEDQAVQQEQVAVVVGALGRPAAGQVAEEEEERPQQRKGQRHELNNDPLPAGTLDTLLNAFKQRVQGAIQAEVVALRDALDNMCNKVLLEGPHHELQGTHVDSPASQGPATSDGDGIVILGGVEAVKAGAGIAITALAGITADRAHAAPAFLTPYATPLGRATPLPPHASPLSKAGAIPLPASPLGETAATPPPASFLGKVASVTPFASFLGRAAAGITSGAGHAATGRASGDAAMMDALPAASKRARGKAGEEEDVPPAKALCSRPEPGEQACSGGHGKGAGGQEEGGVGPDPGPGRLGEGAGLESGGGGVAAEVPAALQGDGQQQQRASSALWQAATVAAWWVGVAGTWMMCTQGGEQP